MKTKLICILILSILLSGCALKRGYLAWQNSVHEYNRRAKEDCLKHHPEAECNVCPYPSTERGSFGGVQAVPCN